MKRPEANQIYCGDVLNVLKTWPDSFVQCVVTSPPFFGLRDYGTAQWEGGDQKCEHKVRTDPHTESSTLGGGKSTTGHQKEGFKDVCGKCGAKRIDLQIGLEESPGKYIAKMTEVFREVRRVLRPDGVCFIEIGDSYAGSWGDSGHRPERTGIAGTQREKNSKSFRRNGHPQTNKPVTASPPGLKPKDLCLIPQRLAIALQGDGWWIRSEIIWSRSNPMPESVTDRFSRSHSTIWMCTKSANYFFDADAIREPNTLESMMRAMRGSSSDNKYAAGSERPPGVHANTMSQGRTYRGYDEMEEAIARGETPLNPAGRNRRSVWEISTQSFPGSHFAVMAEKVAEPCILAGTSERGCCGKCNAPWERQIEKTGEFQRWWSTNNADGSPYNKQSSMQNVYKETGWTPSCTCHGHFDIVIIPSEEKDKPDKKISVYRPHIPLEQHPIDRCIVLDPFSGACTTPLVALKFNRKFLAIELSPAYVKLGSERIKHELAQGKLF